MGTFEFKSAVCTSLEQSKRLLALGLKKETADMAHQPYANIVNKYDLWYRSEIEDNFFPAWSLHRLLLLLDCAYVELDANNPFEDCITRIEFLIQESKTFNKDYLEEK